MKKYPINVDIRISGYFIAKQTSSKMGGPYSCQNYCKYCVP